MVEAGKELLRLTDSRPLLKQGNHSSLHRTTFRQLLKISREETPHLIPILHHPHHKEVIPSAQPESEPHGPVCAYCKGHH